MSDDKDYSSLIIWVVTAILAVLMIGGAIYVSRQNAQNLYEPPKKTSVYEPKTVVTTETAKTKTDPAQTAPAEEKQFEKEPSVESAVPEKVKVKNEGGRPELDLSGLAGSLKIHSGEIERNSGRLSLKHSCYRNNMSPRLKWSDAPQNTESYVIFFEKLETGKEPFMHWMIFNIDGSKNKIEEHIPRQAEYKGMRHAVNDYGNAEYVGPCDPKGKHNYRFRLFALDKVLTAPAGLSRDDLVRAMNGHITDMAVLDVYHLFRN